MATCTKPRVLHHHVRMADASDDFSTLLLFEIIRECTPWNTYTHIYIYMYIISLKSHSLDEPARVLVGRLLFATDGNLRWTFGLWLACNVMIW